MLDKRTPCRILALLLVLIMTSTPFVSALATDGLPEVIYSEPVGEFGHLTSTDDADGANSGSSDGSSDANSGANGGSDPDNVPSGTPPTAVPEGISPSSVGDGNQQPVDFSNEDEDEDEEEEDIPEDVDLSGIEGRVKVTFYVGDAEHHTEMVDRGTLVPAPQQPAREGENFVGWYNRDGGLFLFTTAVEAELNLDAHFEINEYAVQFLDLNGNMMAGRVVQHDECVDTGNLPQLQTSMDKSFLYWYDADADENRGADSNNAPTAFNFNTQITKNYRLAPFVSENRVVIFVSEGTQVSPALINDNIVLEPTKDADGNTLEMKRPGYLFMCWSTVSPGVDTDGNPITQPAFDFTRKYTDSSSLTLYAVWKAQPVSYTIEYWIEKPNVEGSPSPFVQSDDYQYYMTYAVNSADKVLVDSDITGEVLTRDVALRAITLAANKTYITTFFMPNTRDDANADVYLFVEKNAKASGDGSTIVKVYINRYKFKVRFTLNNPQTDPKTKADTSRIGTNAKSYVLGGVEYDVEGKTGAASGYETTYKLDEVFTPKMPSSITYVDPNKPFDTWSGYFTGPASVAAFTETNYALVSTNSGYFGKYSDLFEFRAGYRKCDHYVFRFYYMEVVGATMDSAATVQYTFKDLSGDKVFYVPKYRTYTDPGTKTVRVYEVDTSYTTVAGQTNTVPSGYLGWPGRTIPGYVQANLVINATGGTTIPKQYVQLIDSKGIKDANDVQPMKTDIGQTCYALSYFCKLAPYSLTFNGMGGTVYENATNRSTSYAIQGAMKTNDTVMPDGVELFTANKGQYERFDGWYYDSAFLHPAIVSVNGTVKVYDLPKDSISSNVTLYAKYTNIGVKVYFHEAESDNVKDVKLIDTAETKPGGNITLPPSVANFMEANKDDFSHWAYTSGGMQVQFFVDTPVAATVHVYPVYNTTKVNVTYHYPDDTVKSYAVTPTWSMTRSGMFAPADASRPAEDQMTFLGWYTKDESGNFPVNAQGELDTAQRFTAARAVTKDTELYPVFAGPLSVSAIDVCVDTNPNSTLTALSGTGVAFLLWDNLGMDAKQSVLDAALGETLHTGSDMVTSEISFTMADDIEAYPPTANTVGSGVKGKKLTVTVTDSLKRRKTVQFYLYVVDTAVPLLIAEKPELSYRVGYFDGKTDSEIEEIIARDAIFTMSDDYASESWLANRFTSIGSNLDPETTGNYEVKFQTYDTVGNKSVPAIIQVTMWNDEITAGKTTIQLSELVELLKDENKTKSYLTEYLEPSAVRTPDGDADPINAVDYEDVQPIENRSPGYTVTFSSNLTSGDGTVYVTPDKYVVTTSVNNPAYGSIDSSAEVTYSNATLDEYNTKAAKIGYKPKDGYRVASVTIDDETTTIDYQTISTDATILTEYTFEEVDADHYIVVNFEPINYTVQARYVLQSDHDAEVFPSAMVGTEYNIGDDYSVEPLEIVGFTIVDGETVSGMVGTGDVLVTFEYVPIDYTVTRVCVEMVTGEDDEPVARQIALSEAFENPYVEGGNYHLGEEVTVTAPAIDHFTLADDAEKTVTIEVDADGNADQIVTFVYERKSYTVTSSVSEGGTINPEGEYSYNYQDSTTVSYSANPGYELDYVTVDEVPQTLLNAPQSYRDSFAFDNISKDYTIDVSYKKSDLTLTVHHVEEGTENPLNDDTQQTYQVGDTYTAEAVSIAHYTVVETPVTGTMPATGHEVTIYYTRNQYTITPTVLNGVITPSGAAKVAYEGNQSVSYTPNQGYELEFVKVDGVEVNSSVYGAAYAFAGVDQDHTIDVRYKKSDLTLTIHHVEEGTGNALHDDTQKIYLVGETYTAEEVSIAHYAPVNAPITGIMPATDHEVTIYYQAAEQFTVTASVENGRITPEGKTTLNDQESLLVTYSPKDGYELAEILVDGESVSLDDYSGQYNFQAIDANHTIKVSYTPIQYLLTVHHYLDGTTEPVRADNTEYRKTNESYSVSADRTLTDRTPLSSGVSGIMSARDLTEVIYYQAVESSDGTTDDGITDDGITDDGTTSGNTPSGNTPSGNTPSGSTPSGETSTPSNETPTPSSETPGSGIPSMETPRSETADGEATDGKTIADSWSDKIEYDEVDGMRVPRIPTALVSAAQDREVQPLFAIYDDDIPLTGGATRSMGDKAE